MVKTLRMPDYERHTEFVSLKRPDCYALYDGDVYSSLTKSSVPVSEYRSVCNEYTVPHSTSKWSKWNAESYAVGALARVRPDCG
ncbi:MAG: Ni/Fe hydrogenase subunit alpha, partial [bacterium]|nr:Ni/Fe hydrogenase subunit alpha [bacterium]